MSLLWNGKKFPSFSPTRGLRQGDPLSPYLFVVCMETLSQIINKEVNDGNWNHVRFSRTPPPPISHLFFVDDVILFAKATNSQAKIIADILQHFSNCSGLKVNIMKSKVLFSSSTRMGKMDSIVARIGIQRTLSLEKYLSFHMRHRRLQCRDFEFLGEKISQKLASWQNKLLNKAGCLTFVKSVLNSIPNYYMQIAWLP
jgi:hypothetical protein